MSKAETGETPPLGNAQPDDGRQRENRKEGVMDTADTDHLIWAIATEFPDRDAAFNMIRFALDNDVLHDADLADLLCISDACRLADEDSELRLYHLGEALQYESVESLKSDAESTTDKADIRQRAKSVLNNLSK